jgi:hypothetical protein
MGMGIKYVDVPKHKEPVTDSLGRRKRCLDSERHKSIAAQKPWEALGMSRRTWYRRGLNKSFRPE